MICVACIYWLCTSMLCTSWLCTSMLNTVSPCRRVMMYCGCAWIVSKFAIRSVDHSHTCKQRSCPRSVTCLTAQPSILVGIFISRYRTSSTNLPPWPPSLMTRKTVCLPLPRPRLHVSLIIMLLMVGVMLVPDIIVHKQRKSDRGGSA